MAGKPGRSGRRTKRAEEFDRQIHSMASEYLYNSFPRLQDPNTKLEVALKIVNKFGTNTNKNENTNTEVLSKAEEIAKSLTKGNRMAQAITEQATEALSD